MPKQMPKQLPDDCQRRTSCLRRLQPPTNTLPSSSEENEARIKIDVKAALEAVNTALEAASTALTNGQRPP